VAVTIGLERSAQTAAQTRRLALWLRLQWVRLWAWSATRDGRQALALLALALLVRLVVAPFHGFFHDLQGYVNWGRIFDHHPLNFYSVASTTDLQQAYKFGYLPNYPPLTIYLYGLLDAVYFAAARLVTPHPSFIVADVPLLAAYARLPILAADLGTVAILYRLARQVRSQRWALLAALSYALAPAVLFDGALWGQTDGLFTLAIVAALLCTLRHRGVWAGVFFAAAVMLKPQPAIFGPLILLYLYRWAGWRVALRSLLAMAVALVVLWLPFLLPPRPEALIFVAMVQHVNLGNPYASVDAFNLWWFAGQPHHNALTPYVGPLSATTFGFLLFLAAALAIVAGVWRDGSPARLFLADALLATSFFTLTSMQHERYLFPAIALFLLAAIYDARHLLYYVVTGITAFTNMALAVVINANAPDGFPADPGIDLSSQWDYLIHHGGWTLPIAALNVWLVGVATLFYLRSLRASRAIAAPLPAPQPVTQQP
jgi:Gpi18-like mannosyltransferase